MWYNINADKKDYALTLESSDYADIDQSKLFKHIRSLSPQLEKLCDILRIYLNSKDLNKIQPFEVLMQKSQYTKIGKRFCVLCGKELEPEEKYCIICGTQRID
ncbi:MAG: zinc ribbon domain-containing protein [Bacteroidales bacterium]|nr:zinc ribbon domain-containing protein [Bacteroidales bacterium]